MSASGPQRLRGTAFRLRRGGEVLGERVLRTASLAGRMRGLLGSDAVPGDGLLLDPAGSIHTCFMRIPIDVVFLGRGDRVLAARAPVPPWRLCFAPRGTRRVLETACGFVARHGIMAGDILMFEPRPEP